MHTSSYEFLKDGLLPAQLVTLASNIVSLKVASNFIVNYLTTRYTCHAEHDRRFAVANAGRVTKVVSPTTASVSSGTGAQHAT